MKRVLLIFVALSFLSVSVFASPKQYLCSDLTGGRYLISIESIFMTYPMPEPFPMPNTSGDRSVGSLNENSEENNKMVIITNLKTGRSTSDSLLSFRTADVNFGESTVKLFHHIYTKKTYSCKPKLEQDGPNSQFDVAFGQVVPAFGIGGETTGIGLIGETGKMIEITGTNQEITQELFSLFNETIKVKGYWGKKFGVERGLYDVFFVAKIYR